MRRHYVVRRLDPPTRADRVEAWTIVCDGRELASVAERGRAIDLASNVARVDHEEFGTETDVLVEERDGLRVHACFAASRLG